MTYIIQSIHQFAYQNYTPKKYALAAKDDITASHFIRIRFYFLSFCMLIGLPIFITAAIFIATTVVMLPIAWLCGWL